MSKEVKKQLKELRTIVPNESWKERQRGILMSQIKNTVSDNVPEKNFKDTIMAIGEVFIPLNSIMRFARPVVASFLIVAFALGGGIATVGAAMNSVPGDALYGVKRVTEKVRLTLTPSEIEKAKLQLKFANDRLEEVNKLYKSVDPKKSAKIKVAVNDFQEGIKSMQEKIQQVISNEASETISRMLVQVVDTKLAGGAVKMDHYTIAAKTGTAQVANKDRGGYSDEYLHSFFGYAPAFDPQFLIFMYIERPQGARFASETLSPGFRSMLEFLINYYKINPDR